jgi:hypothetical protein
MDAERQLLDLCERWRSLSEAEGQAISRADWPELQRVQGEKSLLQPQITAVSDRLQAELLKLGSKDDAAQTKLRRVVAELLALERRNDSALAARQQVVRQQQTELAQTSRTLRQVHAAYAPGGRAGWHSYS